IYQFSAGQVSGPGKVGGSIIVDPTLMTQADSDALIAAFQAAALKPTQTFGPISSPTQIQGNGGLNVILVNGNITDSLTLTGTASDIFITNVTGTLTLTGSARLEVSGVNETNVLYNFTNPTGTSAGLSTNAGNRIFGTILAPTQSFSNLKGTFYGEV